MEAGAGELAGKQLGEYQLEGLLGTGGMAVVYRALDLRLNRQVAVKVLPASLASDPAYVTRFRAEAQRVGALNHPHIVPVFSYGEQDGLLYLVMPILHESLRDRMNRERMLLPLESARIVMEIASALEAAHEAGLVHRDVKPENILLDTKGGALLTDFGIAREAAFLRRPGMSQTLAATGLPVGTPEYMAPEQLRAGPVDPRADIYGLGVVLYEMVTGEVPHEADTPYEVASLVLTTPVIPPSVRNPDISHALERVIMRALEKHPDERYRSARAFAEALAEASNQPDTLSIPAVGAWPRRTQRLAGARASLNPMRASMNLARGASLAEDTLPPDLDFPLSGRRRIRGVTGARRWVLLAAGVVLVSAMCGGGVVAALSTFQPGWLTASQANPRATDTLVPTPTILPTATATAIPTATVKPSPTTAPPPTATPVTVLTLVPASTLTLQASGGGFGNSTCTGTLYVQNKSGVKLGWTWTSLKANGQSVSQNLLYYYSYYKYIDNGKSHSTNYASFSNGLPTDSSGIPAGQTEAIALRVTNCSQRLPVTVSMSDTKGHTYSFTMQRS